MAGKRDYGMGFFPGLLAAFFWSFHFPVMFNYVDAAPLVFYLHALLWASIVSLTLLTLTGRMDELSLINRKSGTLFLLVLFGGYGLWVLLALAFHHSEEGRQAVEPLFYTGPVLLVFLSMFMKGGAGRGRLFASCLGFTGAALILYITAGFSIPGLLPFIFSVGAAFCWAVFSLAASTLLSRKETLPALALTLCISTVCVLLTCISMRMDVLAIARHDVWMSMAVGGLSAAAGYGFWMKCMSLQRTPSNAATWWYAALIFGVVGHHVFIDPIPRLPWTIPGIVLILFSFRTTGAGRERTEMILGDMVSRRR